MRSGARRLRRHICLGIALVLFLAAGMVLPGCDRLLSLLRSPRHIDWNDAQIAWIPYNDGIVQAPRLRRPIFLLIYADWCEACEKFAPVFRIPKVIELSKDFVMIRADAERLAWVSDQYRPDGNYYPRVLFLDWTGKADLSIHADDAEDIFFYSHDAPEELIDSMEKARAELK